MKFLKLFLNPDYIGNGFQGLCFVGTWLLLIAVTVDLAIFGPLYLSGNLEWFMRGAGR